MSSTEAPISINLKTAGGTQITLRGETPDEFTALTAYISQIVEAVQEVETTVRGSAPVNTAVPPQPDAAYAAAALGATNMVTVPLSGTPTNGTRMCPHGTMTRIHGLTGKFGPYKGHFCPAKQGDASKCTTQYIKAGQPDWNTFQPDQTKQ
jgi:hypothetical protein